MRLSHLTSTASAASPAKGSMKSLSNVADGYAKDCKTQ